MSIPIVIVVNPSFPAKTVPELIAYAEANPGKVTMATPFSGTLPHLALRCSRRQRAWTCRT